MEPWCKTPAPSLIQAGLLLLLPLLFRPEGCLGAGEVLETLYTAVPRDSGSPCAPSATCPSGGPRLPRQVPAVPTLTLPPSTQPPSTQPPSTPPPSTPPPSQNPGSPVDVDLLPSEYCGLTPSACGMSQEQDPTLRDPEAVARRWPWMVSVWANGTHVCAGTLIASQWVLTVAHCLIGHDVTYSVRVGSPHIDQVAQTTSDVPVRQFIVNSRFRPRRLWSWVGQANNIALLQLEWALKYSKYVRPICLADMDYVVKDQSFCSVTGWGLPKVNGKWPQSRTIQEKEVTILNSKQCDGFYHKFSKIPSVIRIINSQMLCAEDADREQFCYEISGEPLVCLMENTWYLVGMVSWGPGCGKKEAPPIYLRVAAYKHWIWERVNGQALPAPSGVLLLALPLPLSLLAAR
ncbi:probable threonine protease PRSS50 [Pteronotus mesoamericanus]|uniref:probable threonine protease PRSS50 n=1 Tax=Pteronotus mesoamericanus TaxID=1884717 RepID=UPI0023EB8816|nr:probable threonine protease PRSS50 [Pteronotus parnellii mesoamericanus]